MEAPAHLVDRNDDYDDNNDNDDENNNNIDENDGHERMEEEEIAVKAEDETEHPSNESPSFVEEEEDECRVCRSPAEEGRPLLRPCKCSGSMGMVHQECLISWLEVTRGDGRCEICKYKFRFDPQYAENTPDRLPAHEVILGLSSRFLAKWLPLALRILFAASLWLGVAPYFTNCLYLGWIIRPSSILGREDRIASDLVSGAVMGATIIISFLSLMSFADFLRVLWQQPPGAQQEEGEGQQQEEGRENDGVAGGENENDNNEVKIDNTATDRRIIELIEKKKKMTNATTKIDTTITIGDPPEAMEENNEMQPPLLDEWFGSFFSVDAELDILNSHREAVNLRNRATELRNLAMEREARRQNVNANQERPGNDGPDGDVVPVADDAVDFARPNFVVEDVENDNDSDGEDYMEEVDEEDVRNDLEAWMNNDDEDDNDEDDAMPPPFMMAPVGPDDGGVAFDPLDPVLQDDQVVSMIVLRNACFLHSLL